MQREKIHDLYTLSYFRQLPMPRLVEIIRGSAVIPPGVYIDWRDVCIALLERIEDARGYYGVLYEDWE
jgi:hypothetical protein